MDRWTRVSQLAIGGGGGPFDFRGLRGGLLIVNQVAVTVTTFSVLVAAGSLVVRFRRAQGLERQQLRWVALAAALKGMSGVVVLGGVAVGVTAVVNWALGLCVAVLPLAVGAPWLRAARQLAEQVRIVGIREMPTTAPCLREPLSARVRAIRLLAGATFRTPRCA